MDEQTVRVTLEMPARMKDAIAAEAKRRGVSVSALIKLQCAIFLPENIDESILSKRQFV